MRDVVVLGAGPAGSVTAAHLAMRGHDVLVLEEHTEVGVPVHCTGLIGDEAFTEFSIPGELVLSRAGDACFWGAAGQFVRIASSRIRAAVIDRAGLDACLADRAVAAGAELRRGYRADDVRVESDHVVVTVRGEAPVRARACVLACGANYRFHRALGLGLPSLYLQSAQMDTAFPAAGGVEVRLGRQTAPAGFAWLVPYVRAGQTRARIGLMSESRAADRFRTFIGSLCRRAGVVADGLPAPRLKMLPLGPVARTFADRVLAVGDAAGLVKPTTGGGIYYGMLSGAMASETLNTALAADRVDAANLARYEKLWTRRLGAEIRAGLRFRSVAASMTDESIDALIELARVDGVVPLLEKTASFNWHRKAALALLGYPAFRQIAFKSWARSARPL